MHKIILTTALVTLLLLGCGPALSLHSLYTEEDVILDDRIVATWGENKDDCWTFRKSQKGNSYDLILKNNINGGLDSLAFVGHLIKLGSYMFMDVTSRESDVGDFLAVPVHAFLKLSLEGDSLGIAYLDDSWLKENIDNNKIRIKHELQDNNILLTASTKELQQLVVNCADDTEAFEMEYTHRMK